LRILLRAGKDAAKTNTYIIAPHGGDLVLNMASDQEQATLRQLAKSLPQVQIGSRQLADLEMLAI
jgi:sulfate adenylyltransferase